MANTNAPFGLRPIRHQTGGQIRASEYSIASGYSTSIFTGDVVEMTGTGKNVEQAAAANADNIGVFAGCRYVNQQGEQVFSQYWPASTTATEIVAFVYDDPFIVFEVQADSAAEGDVGALADWVVGTGSSVTGQSALYAEVNGETATTAEALRIMGLVNRPGNAFGAYAKLEVMFAEHVLRTGAAGAGGI
jgi:hypothetical protein